MARWTPAEDDQMRWWWGLISAKQLAEKLGRSEGAVISRGVKVLKLGPPARGYLSMAELERRSGFKHSTIVTAAKRLGIPLRRVPRYQRSRRKGARGARHYAIGLEAAERIIEELLSRPDGNRRAVSYRGEWGGPNKPAACLGHGGTDRPHCAKGLCDRCYMRAHRAKQQAIVYEAEGGEEDRPSHGAAGDPRTAG